MNHPHQRSLFRKGVLALALVSLALGVGLLGAGLATPALAQNSSTPTPLPLFALPDSRSPVSASGALAISRDNRMLAAVNTLNNTIALIAPNRGELIAEILVGADPRSLALADDDLLAVVTNRGDGSLTLVNLQQQTVTATIALGGLWPYGVVLNSAGTTAYVALQGSGEIVTVDLNAGQVTARIAVPRFPTGLALWGDFLYVTHFWDGWVSLVYLPQGRVVSTSATGADTGLSAAIEVDPSRGLAYLPQTRSNAQNSSLTFDTVVFPVVNVLDLRGLLPERRSRITLDTADRPVNMPFAAALDRFQQRLYVANAGSSSVSVLDLNTGAARGHIEVGAGPRGILLNRDSSLLFVNNVLDGTLSIIETRSLTVTAEIPISDLTIPSDIIIGAQLFYGAADDRLSADSWVSCANCHFDGMSDGRVWQGFPDGPRNTPLLYNLLETPPYNWFGTWDELTDAELKIRWLQAGTGLLADDQVAPALGNPHAGLSPDLDTLATYLSSLPGPGNPTHFDPALVARGEEVFTAQGCAECHVGAVGTNLQRYDVGTGGEFDTPSLRWLWLSAPYFHDGRARTLDEMFTLPGAHQLARAVGPDDLAALAAYLLAWPPAG